MPLPPSAGGGIPVGRDCLVASQKHQRIAPPRFQLTADADAAGAVASSLTSLAPQAKGTRQPQPPAADRPLRRVPSRTCSSRLRAPCPTFVPAPQTYEQDFFFAREGHKETHATTAVPSSLAPGPSTSNDTAAFQSSSIEAVRLRRRIQEAASLEELVEVLSQQQEHDNGGRGGGGCSATAADPAASAVAVLK